MSGKILVVDDSPEIQELLGLLLQEEGHEVSKVGDAAGLNDAFRGAQPDLVLLDLKLPDADGLDLLPLIKKQWTDTEVIVLTGNATFEAAVEATKRGAYGFQNKPFESKSLLVAVDRALEHKRQTYEASALRQALSTMVGGA